MNTGDLVTVHDSDFEGVVGIVVAVNERMMPHILSVRIFTPEQGSQLLIISEDDVGLLGSVKNKK